LGVASKPLRWLLPNSFALAAAQFGHGVRIAHPTGYELDEELIAEIEKRAADNGGSVEFTTNVNEAFDDVEVVYAKSWGSKQFYGALETEMAFRADMRNSWIVDAEKMSRSNGAIFMHCLPVRRNVIVTDSVIDSNNSVVIDEAENRLHVQKAILSSLIP
jgi:N-acetylornithine carbamoyltransferase